MKQQTQKDKINTINRKWIIKQKQEGKTKGKII